MDNNYNNDQQNTNSEPYGQQNGYGDDPQNTNYGQNDSSFDSQNNNGLTNNAQNVPYGQPSAPQNGPQNNPYGQQQSAPQYGPNPYGQQQGAPQYGPQNNPYGQPNNNQYGPYVQNPYIPPQPEEGSVGLAVASMVLGICAILISCCFYPVAFLLALVGLILGAVAIKKGPAGRGMAVTGLILSIIAVAIAVFVLLFAASFGLGMKSLL